MKYYHIDPYTEVNDHALDWLRAAKAADIACEEIGRKYGATFTRLKSRYYFLGGGIMGLYFGNNPITPKCWDVIDIRKRNTDLYYPSKTFNSGAYERISSAPEVSCAEIHRLVKGIGMYDQIGGINLSNIGTCHFWAYDNYTPPSCVLELTESQYNEILIP